MSDSITANNSQSDTGFGFGLQQSAKTNPPYIGRFAPSPTGPLHFGSLLAAVASYLDARANNGKWLVRMEDLDPPREPPGAAEQILTQLQELGLHWDSDLLYQSQRLESYQQALQTLQERQLCYRCDCSRAQIKAMGSIYNGACQSRQCPPQQEFAWRVKCIDETIEFHDLIQGPYLQNPRTEVGDFVIKRKDKLFAYQLAVVVDDNFQGVSHVIRGIDLLDSTPRQIYLQQLLDYPTPVYGHIPVIVNNLGQKLSKQHFAEPLNMNNKRDDMHRALILLGQNPEPAQHRLDVHQQLAAAVQNWQVQSVPKLATLPLLTEN